MLFGIVYLKWHRELCILCEFKWFCFIELHSLAQRVRVRFWFLLSLVLSGGVFWIDRIFQQHLSWIIYRPCCVSNSTYGLSIHFVFFNFCGWALLWFLALWWRRWFWFILSYFCCGTLAVWCLSVKDWGVQRSDKRAHCGCLGDKRRWKTWHAAISHGELQVGFDPWISEWGNPTVRSSCTEYIGVWSEPGELKHLSSRRKGHQPRLR